MAEDFEKFTGDLTCRHFDEVLWEMYLDYQENMDPIESGYVEELMHGSIMPLLETVSAYTDLPIRFLCMPVLLHIEHELDDEIKAAENGEYIEPLPDFLTRMSRGKH